MRSKRQADDGAQTSKRVLIPAAEAQREPAPEAEPQPTPEGANHEG